MKRRGFLQGSAATAMVGGLAGLSATSLEALASDSEPLDVRIERLREHIQLLRGRAPASILARGMAKQGFPPKMFANILAGLLVARVLKSSSEAEQEDPRWRPVLEDTMAPFTEGMALLLNWLESTGSNRAGRRMLRRPNRLARVLQRSLAGKQTPQREAELRQVTGAMAAAARDRDLYQEAIFSFDEVAEAAETNRMELSMTSLKVEDDEKKLLIGLLLLLGGVTCYYIGLFAIGGGIVTLLDSNLLGIPLVVLGIPFCIAAVVMLVNGVTLVIQGIKYKFSKHRDGIDSAANLTENELALLEDIEALLAA